MASQALQMKQAQREGMQVAPGSRQERGSGRQRGNQDPPELGGGSSSTALGEGAQLCASGPHNWPLTDAPSVATTPWEGVVPCPE